MEGQVLPQPVGEVTWWRRLLSYLPGFCGYCGYRYVPCHRRDISLLAPLPPNGVCCPDGHEGYVDRFIGYGWIRYEFDYVKDPPPTPVTREELLMEDES